MSSQLSHEKRIKSEIAHGKKLSANAEKVWHWEGSIGRARYKRRVKFLSSALRNGVKCLEVGCGTGLFTQDLVKSGADITAIDISADLLEHAKKKVPNVTFLEKDACYTGFPDESFDVVVGSSILHHLDIDLSLKEIYRILKKDGTLWFTEPNYLNPHVYLERRVEFLRIKLGVSEYETAFVRWPLAKKLKETGFTSVEVKPFDFLYPFLPENCLAFMEKVGMLTEQIPLIKEIAGSLQITATKSV